MSKQDPSASPTRLTTPRTRVQKLLTVGEVADILGISKVKVYALLKEGLPSVKIGGARRIQPEKLQAWIERQSA
jgi:excisionase family DNA binding protein